MSHLTESEESLWSQVVSGLSAEGFTFAPLTEARSEFLARALGDSDEYLFDSPSHLLAQLNSHFGGSAVSHLTMGVAELLYTLGLTLDAGEGGGGNPAWVPDGALAWADFKAGVYSANSGAITTLLGMWDKDFPDPDTFDPASAQAGVGLVNDAANLTDAAAADLLAGFTAVMLVDLNDGSATTLTAYEADFDFEFRASVRHSEVIAEDFFDLLLVQGELGEGLFEFKATITPTTMSICVGGGVVDTGTPEEGAVFGKIVLNNITANIVERIAFLPPQADAALPALSVAD
jgi:hypothetical protein